MRISVSTRIGISVSISILDYRSISASICIGISIGRQRRQSHHGRRPLLNCTPNRQLLLVACLPRPMLGLSQSFGLPHPCLSVQVCSRATCLNRSFFLLSSGLGNTRACTSTRFRRRSSCRRDLRRVRPSVILRRRRRRHKHRRPLQGTTWHR